MPKREANWLGRLNERYRQAAQPHKELIVWNVSGQATLYGCRKILLYSETEIRIQMGKRILSVQGKNLACISFSAGTVTIEGMIVAIGFPDSGTPAGRK